MNKIFKINQQSYLGLLGFFGILLLLPAQAFATLNLSANPINGGRDIRFGRVGIPAAFNSEVRLRVTSSETQQYQVFQRMVQPFQNEKGQMVDQNVLLASAVTGSNGSGTVYLQGAERLSYTDQLLYTSNPSGLSDSFVIVYEVDVERLSRSGDFIGQILYTLRPIGGAGQDEVVLNVSFESGGDFKIEIGTSSGIDQVRLGTENQFEKQAYVKFAFSGNSGNQIKIYQEIIQPPVNEMSDPLNLNTVHFYTSGGSAGQLNYQSPSEMIRGRELLYSSKAEEDTMYVHFEVDEEHFAQQKAGQFNGPIRFIVDDGTIEKIYDVRFEVNVPAVFELLTEYPPEGMRFAKVLPITPPQTREVRVTVKTNLGAPYWVSQNSSGPLANEEGSAIEKNYFTFKQEVIDGQPGKVPNPDFSPIPDGEIPLFYSDSKGSPAQFKVIYRLRPYQNMEAGSYKTAIVYSLGEI